MWPGFLKTCQSLRDGIQGKVTAVKAWVQGHPYRPLTWFLILYTVATGLIVWIVWESLT